MPFHISRYASAMGAAAGLLAACGGSQPPPGARGVIPPLIGLTPTVGSSLHLERDGAANLIYVADNNSTVHIYSYPRGKRAGTLTGFGWVASACADTKGNVFIVDSGKSAIFEYATGGTTPIEVLHDEGYTPTGWSVDPTTGSVAVANVYASDYTSGTIAIYDRRSAAPRLLTDPNIFEPRYCGYDASGNLYLDGYSNSLPIVFAELPIHSIHFTNITLNETIDEPGTVQWDGKHVAVGDASKNVIYQFKIAGSSGLEVGSTTLDGVTYGLNQFWIEGGQVVGAAAVDSEVGLWKYPAGGSALKTIKQGPSY